MQPVVALILTLLMSLAPALLFVGLLKGLRGLQSTALVSNVDGRMDEDVSEVSLSDAAESVFQGRSIMPQTSSNSERSPTSFCNVCGQDNDSTATYCHKCMSRL